jgi:RNA polymerase sigma factor (sigma-70 family)
MAEPAQDLERLVAQARAGDATALESVVAAIEKDVRRLARRFLWNPQDAEDAAQEILVRVVTGLEGFRGDASFRTWVYRVACNALLSAQPSAMERQALSFEQFAEELGRGLAEAPAEAVGAEHALLLEEIKIGCTIGMLLCLDREHRLAYVLGEIMELEHGEAAAALQIAPAAYRKRLSRARERITALMLARCGLVREQNPCRCRRRVATAIELGRLDPQRLLFASSLEQARQFPQVLAEIRRLEEARRAAALFRSHGDAEPSRSFVVWLRELVAGTR